MWQTSLVAIVVLSLTVDAAEPVLRVREDRARGTRWELGWGTVSAFDVATGQRIRVIALAGANQSGAKGTCFPDMLLARDGALVVSSNAQPSLWRISPSRFEVERIDIALDGESDKDFGFTSLAWGENERVLYASSAIMGSLWRIDLASMTGRKVDSSPLARGACRP